MKINNDFLVVLITLLLCSLVRLLNKKTVSLREVSQELILSSVIAIFFFNLGITEGLSTPQILCLAIPACLGNSRIIQYIASMLKSLR